MADLNWVQIGVGFAIGVIASYFVCDLVYPIKKRDE